MCENKSEPSSLAELRRVSAADVDVVVGARRRRNTLLVAFWEQFKYFARLKYKVFVEIVFFCFCFVYSACVISILLVAGNWQNSSWTERLAVFHTYFGFSGVSLSNFCAIILFNVRHRMECEECFTLSGQSQLFGICMNAFASSEIDWSVKTYRHQAYV